MKLSKDLREFIELLNSKKVKYLIVGGYAVAYHGHPRFTGDIDFFVESSPGNASLLEDILRTFGFADLGMSKEDFLKPEQVIQLGRPPNRIDILTSISGVNFSEAWNTKTTADFDGLPVFIISKKFLIQNKKTVQRAQDIADLNKISGEG